MFCIFVFLGLDAACTKTDCSTRGSTACNRTGSDNIALRSAGLILGPSFSSIRSWACIFSSFSDVKFSYLTTASDLTGMN